MAAPLPNRRNIFDLHYRADSAGNDVLCAPDGSPYAGIVYEALPSGFVTLEYEVENGLKDGAEREFYSDGSVATITHYRQGWLHGDVVYYSADGIPQEKSVFAYEVLLEEFAWNEAGVLMHHRAFELSEGHRRLIERLNARYQLSD